jgi:hypothetical protein
MDNTIGGPRYIIIDREPRLVDRVTTVFSGKDDIEQRYQCITTHEVSVLTPNLVGGGCTGGWLTGLSTFAATDTT